MIKTIIVTALLFTSSVTAKEFTDDSNAQLAAGWIQLHQQCEQLVGSVPDTHFKTPYGIGILYSKCMAEAYKQTADNLQKLSDREFKEL